MHNVPSLVSGRERCVLYVHPDDAARYEVRDGETAILESRVHRGEVRIAVTDEMRPGVVSLPHGWGHAESARWQKVAGRHAGVSVNDWVDDAVVEPINGWSTRDAITPSAAPVRVRIIVAEACRGPIPRGPTSRDAGFRIDDPRHADLSSLRS
jgi:anaerobic selenocysteine-containing dehydrogenase